MGRVLIIGAGGVGTVVAHKVAQNADVFTDIMIASRTKEKCDKIVEAIGNPNIKTAKVDADNVDELVALFNDFKPEMVINVALPYQDLTIMEACLKDTGLTFEVVDEVVIVKPAVQVMNSVPQKKMVLSLSLIHI